jgi:hypothetical protein
MPPKAPIEVALIGEAHRRGDFGDGLGGFVDIFSSTSA